MDWFCLGRAGLSMVRLRFVYVRLDFVVLYWVRLFLVMVVWVSLC
jgi:hypothetical protein